MTNKGYGPIFDALPNTDKEIRSGEGICDFCSPPGPTAWIYPCLTFRLPVPPGLNPWGKKHYPRSEGDWGACETCAELIEANKRDELVRRCNHDHPVLIDLQTKVIALFFRNRKDEPRFAVPEGAHSILYPGLVITPDAKKEGL